MFRLFIILFLTGGFLFTESGTIQAQYQDEPMRKQAQKSLEEGNYKVAFEQYRQLLLDKTSNPLKVGDDLDKALTCLTKLRRDAEADELRELALQVHQKNWRFLHAAALSFVNGEHYGVLINDEFFRGGRHGGGKYVRADEEDRIRALQLYVSAEKLLQGSIKSGEKISNSEQAKFYMNFAEALELGRGYNKLFQLQVLSDLETVPTYTDLEDGYHSGSRSSGMPVDENDNPVLFDLPESFDSATSDGERWRWVLHQAENISEKNRQAVSLVIAEFAEKYLGVHTLRSYPNLWKMMSDQTEFDSETAPYTLHTLTDEETIVRLATGIKRIQLAEDYNFIHRYQEIANDHKSPLAEAALKELSEIFQNRRQYGRAAETIKESIERYGTGAHSHKKKQLNQIVGNWGELRPEGDEQVAGRGATVEYEYRNGKQVKFKAYVVKIEQLIKDSMKHFESSPDQIQLIYDDPERIGEFIVRENNKKYLGEKVASWTHDLSPLPNHFNKSDTITTPLQKPGAYLLVAEMQNGNKSRKIIWINDTVIVKKSAGKHFWLYVADAKTGKPIPGADVELFGYRIFRGTDRTRNKITIKTKHLAERTDENGQLFTLLDVKNDYGWVVVARTPSGRFAHIGVHDYWNSRYGDSVRKRGKAFFISDRPVYRPKDKVRFKFWIQNATYDPQDKSDYANQKVAIELTGPMGTEIFKKPFKTDEFGGVEGEYELPEEADLGNYNLRVTLPANISGSGHFRVEEYKKPEYEVTVESPEEPIRLGDKIKAEIKANYYFGAPVQNATVKYTVKRSAYTDRWFPFSRWDWLYGVGYWWYATDWDWYPGWQEWSCPRPVALWWPVRPEPPEIVMEEEVEIGPEGTVNVEIDTMLAKLVHSDKDHEYTITAEVRDESRRTIVGTGSILVAREPFEITGWGDRGFYQTGDRVAASFKALTLDRKPVIGEGTLKLMKITYDEQLKPQETEVESWKVETDAEGLASHLFRAAEPGQYRVSYSLTDKKGNTEEGAWIFNVVGTGFEGRDFQYNDLEMTVENKDYQPGDRVKLLLNTNRADSTVMLFLRPENDYQTKPKTIRLQGKSTTFEFEVQKADMPNIFVEAVTISNGELHQVVRQITIPPEKRITNVEVISEQKNYQPGEEATLQLRLTDLEGKPVVGSVALAIYDKSVEYISGGSNIKEIKKFFWDFKRSHQPESRFSAERASYLLYKKNEELMQSLGVFGDVLMEGLAAGGGAIQFQAMAAPTPAGSVTRERSTSVDSMLLGDAGGAKSITNYFSETAGTQEEPTLRSNFEDTAFWAGALTPDENGVVNVSFPLPDSLTTWKIRSWSMGAGTRVGQGETEIITSKNLLVRLQAPRFFVETDEVVLSANVHSYLENDKDVTVQLELDGNTLESLSDLSQMVTIKAGEEQRIDWRVKVAKSGEAVIRMKALTDEESDAVEMTFPVYLHGTEIMHSYAGSLRPEDTIGKVEFDIPSARIEEQSRFEVRFSPSLAAAMVDALPYLVNYPHKTTDTTVHRFSSTAITFNILKGMGIDLKALKEKQVNLNAQELGDPQVRAGQWKRFDRNPVFDPAEVEKMMKQHVQDLNKMQLSDGGWGWLWGYRERSSAHLTAQVVHGLQLAQKNNVALIPGMLKRGTAWLEQYQNRQVRLLQNWEENDQKKAKHKKYKRHVSQLDALVFMVLVEGGVENRQMLKYLKRDRVELSVYAKALFGLALHKLGEEQELNKVLKNLEQFLVQDDENQTAWLQLPEGGYWWYWYGSGSEANAVYLKLLAKTEPRSERTSRLAKYLLNNRKHSNYWNSTRDTALAIEALAEFMVASGENKPEMTVEVWFDGQKQKEVKITPETLFDFENSFVIEGADLTSGRHTLELRKTGSGPLYYNAYSSNFSQEEFLKKAGLEVKVERFYYKLIRDDKETQVAGDRGQAIGQRTEKYRREPIVNNAQIKSGDLIEVELVIDTKNDYEYLIFEDYKGAGLEPVDLRSGYTGNSLGAYLQFRDEKVTAYVRHLPHGKHNLIYRLRAEIPGRFSVLPAKGLGMHAPELKGNSDELKVEILD